MKKGGYLNLSLLIMIPKIAAVELALQWVKNHGQVKGYANGLYMPDGGALSAALNPRSPVHLTLSKSNLMEIKCGMSLMDLSL